ncbi:fluoride efflux transporter CrcB [Anaerobacillus sp. MEB173]|uniref:fluoride efflux transporter CrcB n=1 Tax=Anaerobacillus sp. MEB173 TaxID=3383345 RepID=UPI003F91DD78
MNNWLIMIGGCLGAISRYAAGLYLMKLFPKPPIPIAMLTVNLLGSLGLGFFLGSYFSEIPISSDQPIYLLLAVGFFGAFTTFSTFSVEAMQLLRDRQLKQAILYIGLSIFGSILCFIIGFYLTI